MPYEGRSLLGSHSLLNVIGCVTTKEASCRPVYQNVIYSFSENMIYKLTLDFTMIQPCMQPNDATPSDSDPIVLTSSG
ncbi:unnamed protein product [Gongylonema pulchrum]|uniref:ZP domain-containing protein n=1 Tax=Gongylonema pulchrum TaxID=637853 RepID=A0A183DAX1_9BILA|nr:unnamed protein product [Gongylonema pulchrum]